MNEFEEGQKVTWLDSSGRRHEGIVTRDDDVPAAFKIERRIYVIETTTSHIPYFVEPSRLELVGVET